ncbi:hypothetical protein GCM10010451_24630 [Streptomyces virens]|uniref:Uncharacterized protein n=1 Tax=Streptomyces virens TaxID=285572 RepID=A0ABP6PDH2_9ACTN
MGPDGGRAAALPRRCASGAVAGRPARGGRRAPRGAYSTAVISGVISSIAYGIDRTVLKENAAPMSGSW